jgi:hypothetical protein
MFLDTELNSHLETASTIKSQSAVFAEWNMNFADNLASIGNYRYRKFAGPSSVYSTLPNSFDINDIGNFYAGATDADTIIDGGMDTTTDQPIFFISKKAKESLLYSLEDCFTRFRPRSGINKIRYGITKYLHHSNSEMFNRPRYYMADKNDLFKYWTSFRTESGVDYGIANRIVNNRNYIDDAVPYVVYKNQIPVNRIITKLQTNVGNVDLGPFSSSFGTSADPFYGDANKTTPVIWKIQYLDSNNSWVDAIKFDEHSKRVDGSAVIGTDGYVEISYGLIIPNDFKDIFVYDGQYTSQSLLPTSNVNGHAYLVKKNVSEPGRYYIWIDNSYKSFEPKFGWYLEDSQATQTTSVVTDTVNHKMHINPGDGKIQLEEFTYINGIRIVVETMNKLGSTLDLIELSPRLVVDLSEKTKSFSVKKPASDLGLDGLPVGQLLAATGSLDIFDYDQAFNAENPNSIIAKYINRHMQIKFYEIVVDVPIINPVTGRGQTVNHYVPIKTMYSEGFPTINNKDQTVTIQLRDLYFYFESITAPEILIEDVSLSYAVSLLMDSIGFSNYEFKRLPSEVDPIIPFFFIGPKQTVAQVLQSLAISTQTAMFFDEVNNFILMTKGYLMPAITDRITDLTLYGSQDSESSGVVKNKRNNKTIANIVEIASQNNTVYNDGKISYTTRYIQKSYGTIKQAYLLDKEKRWIYKPAMLWEVSGSGNTKSVNNETATQGKYALAAIPLNSTLTSDIPSVYNGEIINNIIDLGEAVYWMPRYTGYFYANGEVIKYDAVEYNVASVGNVWISNIQDYQNYFSQISFNGKIYPTGRVRIYAEPNYDIVNDITFLRSGAVAKHGRGQFGTTITSHSAGINNYWTNSDAKTTPVRGCNMESKYLFDPSLIYTNGISTVTGKSGINPTLASKTSRGGIIKNFLSQTYAQETDISTSSQTDGQTVQASAFVMEGPPFAADESPQDFLSYVYKPLAVTTVDVKTGKVSTAGTAFKNFGTRIRIVGKVQNNDTSVQSATGATPYYTATQKDSSANITISGGGGGLAVMVNPNTNEGYYFEITALSEDNTQQYVDSTMIKNITFYKLQRNASAGADSDKAIPVFLNTVGTKDIWPGGLAQVQVDSGTFVGQSRVADESKNTVYDIAVEYQDVGSVRRFYLYLNNTQVATLEDTSPLPIYNNIAMFVRGSSKCMFENLYALSNNYSENSSFGTDLVADSVFGDSQITANESFRKYAISGMVQSTYLSGISATEPPKHNIYYEEFGTVMREASYFNIKYDKAYPALYSKIAPTFNSLRGYTVSGFYGGSYGAEFLIFNNTDMTLTLDETSGNYLRILGITFTQGAQSDLTVDEFYSKKSDFSNPNIVNNTLIDSPLVAKKDYYDIKSSRLIYGKNEFNLDATYIQSQDAATEMMSWILSKIAKPRLSVGVKIFANPTIQLGDIVNIDYAKDGINQIADPSTRFIVYNIEYQKTSTGPDMTVYLSEVV